MKIEDVLAAMPFKFETNPEPQQFDEDQMSDPMDDITEQMNKDMQ